jgi:4-alpha-glucanotransferase
MVRLAMMSPARLCILPIQDLLGLGSEARINSPGRSENNWLWRLTAEQSAALPLKRLLELAEAFGRL